MCTAVWPIALARWIFLRLHLFVCDDVRGQKKFAVCSTDQAVPAEIVRRRLRLSVKDSLCQSVVWLIVRLVRLHASEFHAQEMAGKASEWTPSH
jgi:hypothetical protein